MTKANYGGVEFVGIEDIAEVTVDSHGSLKRNWDWVNHQLGQLSETYGGLFGAVWGDTEPGISGALILTPTKLLLVDKGLHKQGRELKIAHEIDLKQVESVEVNKKTFELLHGGKRTRITVFFAKELVPELVGKILSLRDFLQTDQFGSAISNAFSAVGGIYSPVPLEPVKIDAAIIPTDSGFLALYVGGAGYSLREGQMHRVMLAPDKASLFLVDLSAGTALPVPANRLIALDYEGGEFQKGGNLVGGGFGIVGAAIGIAGAAAINKVTRKSFTQTICKISTDDGEITLYTDEVAPHEIDQMLSEFRLASRKSRSQELSPPAESKGSSDLATQIRELSALHADGILSDEEFAKAKERVLGSQS
jgi:hypothetical protein